MLKNLETSRLMLKSISLDDAEPCSSVNEAKEWIDFYLESKPRNQQCWILVLKENGESIGACGYHCWNREYGEVERDYDLYPIYWRQEYTSETLKKIIEIR